MAKFVGTPVSVIDLLNPGDVAVQTRVVNDTQARVRIDAGGKLTWGSGSAAGDTTLYRSDADTLTTDDVFAALAGLVTLTTSGTPTEVLPNGAIAVDAANDVFYFRSNGTWNEVSGGRASVADTAPEDPTEGDLWFESDTLDLFIYYTSVWLQLTGLDDGVVDIGDLADVLITNPLQNEVLTYVGTDWINQPPTGTALTDATIIAGIGGDGTSGQAIVTDGAGSLSFSTIIGTTEASIVSAVGADGAAGQVLKTNGAGDLSFGDVAQAQPLGVAFEHLDVGEQVVADGDRLRPLQVRVARHRGRGVALGLREQRVNRIVVLKLRRPQIAHGATHLRKRLLAALHRALEPRAILAGDVARGEPEIDLQRGEPLADRVVEIPRDALALVFLHREQPRGEPAEGFVVRIPIPPGV